MGNGMRGGLVALALLGAACGTGGDAGSAGGERRKVLVDSRADGFNAAFLAYFPNTVTVGPGDTVSFEAAETGEPHSVTMGTLVEAGLAAADKASPDGPPPPEMRKLPVMLPEGPGDAHQNAAQPCFLDSGEPPSDTKQACAKRKQPDFTGKQTYYSSGYIPGGDSFDVKLADDVEPGTYRYYCNLHGASMAGKIVVTEGDEIPSQADVDAKGEEERDALVAKLRPAYETAKAGKAAFPGNLAGLGAPDVQTALVNEFVPAAIKAKVGEKVTWTIFGPHTISFGAPGDAGPPILTVAGDGAVHLIEKGVAPAGGPGAPQGPPPEGQQGPRVVDAGTYDGSGFKSSGLIISFPPNLVGYAVTFTKAGTYAYTCLIHPRMGGSIEVA